MRSGGCLFRLCGLRPGNPCGSVGCRSNAVLTACSAGEKRAACENLSMSAALEGMVTALACCCRDVGVRGIMCNLLLAFGSRFPFHIILFLCFTCASNAVK